MMGKTTNLEIGQVLNFIPPELDGEDNKEHYRRYMLVIYNNIKNNTIKLLNISKLSGKENKMIYDSNLPMQNYFPFVQPSFVKLKTIYEIENFEELTDYISYNGEKVTEQQLNIIFQKKHEYDAKHKNFNSIKIEKETFLEINKNTSRVWKF